MDYILYFYPTLILLGIATTYTDIRFQKIKNWHLAIAAGAGILTYLYLILTGAMQLTIALALNPLVALILGFILYTTGVWAAGDGKLFTVFCLLMPTENYADLIPLPSLIVFIAVFLIASLFLLLFSFGRIAKKRAMLTNKVFWKAILGGMCKSYVIIFSLSWLIIRLTDPLKPYINMFLLTVILFLCYTSLYRLLQKVPNVALTTGILVSGIVLRSIFEPYIFTYPVILNVLKVAAVYTLVFFFLNSLLVLIGSGDHKERRVPFAPLMFAGTLAANTGFLYWFMELLKNLRR